MSLSILPWTFHPHSFTFTACSFAKRKYCPRHIETNCPMIVATAAPVTPISGNGPTPKINIGSRMIFVTAPHMLQIIGIFMFPVDCRIFSDVICIMENSEPTVIMNMYFSPFSTMYGVSDIICIIGPDRNIPISAKNIQLKNEILYPWLAARSASS